jgi:RimJ/RimL family protein N-acetyltransferase
MDEPKKTSSTEPLPHQTLEALAKTIFRQAQQYGFSKQDWVRLVNILLDMGMAPSGMYTPPPTQDITPTDPARPEPPGDLTVRIYTPDDFEMLNIWVIEADGKNFLATRTDSLRHDTLDGVLDDESSVVGIIQLDGRPVGALAFLNIDRDQGKAEMRKLIADPGVRGKGYARKATQYWIEYGVSTLGLRKIYLHTLDTNLANIKLNEQLGFRVEGLLRDEVKIDGVYHDVLRMSLILPH